MKNSRNYSFKDVDMLLASRIIAQNFKSHLPELNGIRTNWNDKYANDLVDRIDSVIEDYLGIDRRKELKEATENVTKTESSVLRDLIFLKTQISVDLPEEAEKIHDRLGLSRYSDIVKYRDQESLIEMLFVFKKEMNDKLKTKICSKGINPMIIDGIVDYANQLRLLNTIQETLKKTTKQVTGNVVNIFNELYHEVSGICKIAWTYYQMEPLKQEQFVFSGIVKNMNLD